MVKFASFERTVEFLYKTFLPKPKSEYNKLQQVIHITRIPYAFLHLNDSLVLVSLVAISLVSFVP